MYLMGGWIVGKREVEDISKAILNALQQGMTIQADGNYIVISRGKVGEVICAKRDLDPMHEGVSLHYNFRFVDRYGRKY